jgi:hypothetical protein
MVKARFYDIDTLLTIENQAWVVNKDQPNIPLYKIEKSDFNLIKSGIYRKQNNKIDFNGKTFWLPTQLVNELKVKAKSYKTDFSNLAISMQEFLNKDIIDHLDYSLNEGLIDDLKNSSDDIYIICNRQSKRNYESLLQKLEEQLKEVGVSIKAFYYISENFYNQNDDEFKFKKMRLLLQHLVGYKTDGDKFIDEEVTRYNSMRYYDNNYDTLKFADDINPLFEIILSKTDNGVREVIKEDVKEYRPSLMINKVNDNLYNRLEEKKVIINLSNIVMTFESFRKLN